MKFIFSCLILLQFLISFSFADVIELNDGSIMNGKILNKTDEQITFSNYYGTFTIQRKIIKIFYETSNFNEDVKIFSNMKKPVDREHIRRNFESGMKNKRTLGNDDDSREDTSFHGRRKKSFPGLACSISTAYIATTGKLKEFLPRGFGQFFSLDLGFTGTSRRPAYLPDLRFETGYLTYKNENSSFTGISAMAGPSWLLPLGKNHRGGIHLSILSGVTMQKKVEYKGNITTGRTFSMSPGLGYEIHFGNINLFLRSRYLHIFDVNYSLTGFGGEFGMGIRLR